MKNKEKMEGCAIRETFDETGLIINYLKKRGIILFKFETTEQDHEVHIYETDYYEGILDTSKDFINYAWFHRNNLPFDAMMPADKYWFPLFTQGKLFKGEVYFDREFKNPTVNIKEVKSLD